MSDKILKLDQAQTLYSDLRERIDALPTTEDITVQDVQIDGTSILDNGVANIPLASGGQKGIVEIAGTRGIRTYTDSNNINTGVLEIVKAGSSAIKVGTNELLPIVPYNQHRATFYGLAKAAGDVTQASSDNAVGTYTDGAKAAIQNMLDVPSNAAMTTAIGNAIGNINSFDMAVVQALPTENISTHTIYLVPKTGETNDVYDEYVYINSNWEMVGNTQVDLSNYVQKTDYATASNAGVVKIQNKSWGLSIADNGLLYINPATSSYIKNSANYAAAQYTPISLYRQHESTFYGLAKAAGDTTQSQSDNDVGTYTAEAKAAIQTMLDTPSNADLTLKADKTDTILETTLSRGRKDNTTVGGASLAFGIDTEASGYYSVALGLNTTASSQGAFAEGKNTVAHYIAHAEGENSQALSSWSHAQNLSTIANGGASSASGRSTIANGADSFVFGRYNAADSYDNWPTWTANTSYEVGDRVKRNLMVQNEPTDVGYHCTVANSDATFDTAHWELDGYHMNYVEIVGNGKEYEDPETHQTVRAGSNAYALEWNGTAHFAGDVYVGANADSSGGVKVATVNDVSIYATKADTVLETTLSRGRKENTTIGMASIAFGVNVEASGMYSIATGMMTTASNNHAKAEGYRTTASGSAAHAEGSRTVASGINAHAEGTDTTATAEAAHSEGTRTTAGGTGSHSEGYGTLANACLLHTEGRYNQGATIYSDWTANTEYAIGDKVSFHGIGYICTDDNTDAEWNNEHWQIIFHNSNRAFIVGNGTTDNARSNAYALDWDGTGHYMGDVYVGANADSTGGTRLATVTELAAKLDAAEAGLKVVRLI